MATEKRLISLDEALEATHKEAFWTESEQAAVRSFLVKQPVVDAVEVVRCKDCINYNHKGCADGFGWCEAWDQGRMDHHFCHCGERKENG